MPPKLNSYSKLYNIRQSKTALIQTNKQTNYPNYHIKAQRAEWIPITWSHEGCYFGVVILWWTPLCVYNV